MPTSKLSWKSGFVYIKTFRKKIGFCIWMKIKMTAISKRQRARLYTQKAKKTKRFYIQKARHFSKSKTISVTFLHTKSQTFMKVLKLAFIFKNHDTLRYVTFIYTKRYTLSKKQDNLWYVFIYKNPALLFCAIFHWIFEICGGGGTFIYKKNNVLCVIFLYWKTMHFALRCYIQRAWHYALHFNIKKKKTLFFMFKYIIYPGVLIPNYKRT